MFKTTFTLNPFFKLTYSHAFTITFHCNLLLHKKTNSPIREWAPSHEQGVGQSQKEGMFLKVSIKGRLAFP